MLLLSVYSMALLAVFGIIVDRLLGEPRTRHPLVGFGRLATRIEAHMNTGHRARPAGILAWFAAAMPPVLVAWFIVSVLPFSYACIVHVLLLWLALGAKSLHDHIAPIARALSFGDIDNARALTSRIVSRDTSKADVNALSRAAIESALENGNDAIFGVLFWFAIAGGPGALMFRLANTLDAMWGYRTPRYLCFGWATARFDDALNFIPARFTAASYALTGDTHMAWHCWRTQARSWDSPNAGPVMASGAGSLNVLIGGAAVYHGVLEARPTLGAGHDATPRHVVPALRLVERSTLLWLAVLLILALLSATAHG
ncbi:Adenosylcobinamide-phosphate synthase [Candidatus Burkholderia pumila]|uniref:Cobalamin biosynthesis protein CobD n=1 Tax=Candidatus Burkholderia pumila TaxID=1090375 RepID=A0ABR5HMP4_9BURK|nr:Adenosylcobinamide-phosphate synthase [Candidatus Burkholderia pumila]